MATSRVISGSAALFCPKKKYFSLFPFVSLSLTCGHTNRRQKTCLFTSTQQNTGMEWRLRFVRARIENWPHGQSRFYSTPPRCEFSVIKQQKCCVSHSWKKATKIPKKNFLNHSFVFCRNNAGRNFWIENHDHTKVARKKRKKKNGHTGGLKSDGNVSMVEAFCFFCVFLFCPVRFYPVMGTTVASRDCCFSVVLPIIVYDEAGRAWRKKFLVAAGWLHVARTMPFWKHGCCCCWKRRLTNRK